MSDTALRRAAEAACDCLAVSEVDDLLIVSNEEQEPIAAALGAAGAPRARTVRNVSFPAVTRHGEEPPAYVAEAMAHANVIFTPTTYSLSHTQARAQATEGNARIATIDRALERVFADTASRSTTSSSRQTPIDALIPNAMCGQVPRLPGRLHSQVLLFRADDSPAPSPCRYLSQHGCSRIPALGPDLERAS